MSLENKCEHEKVIYEGSNQLVVEETVYMSDYYTCLNCLSTITVKEGDTLTATDLVIKRTDGLYQRIYQLNRPRYDPHMQPSEN